ncbi:uncharacterized protein [Diadema setosum]|uniref:uncharacterized protein n=1 Tax=Diadema setosum TaxID=31175 RepID=UPI003B3A82FE
MAGREHLPDHARADARRKRQPAQESKHERSTPIFEAPVRSNVKDDLSLSIEKSLGSYTHFKLPFIRGVEYQPQTPQPGDGKNISQFPLNGQMKGSGGSSSGQQSSRPHQPGSAPRQAGHAKSSPAEAHKRSQSKQAPAGASSVKGVKREPGPTSQTPSSTSLSSSSSSSTSLHKPPRPSSHDKAKEGSNQRRSKESFVRSSKPQSSSTASESNSSQSRTSSNLSSSKANHTLSMSSSSSASAPRVGSSRPSASSASRGSASSSSNASDSKTVLHANGLLTETTSNGSMASYPMRTASIKTEPKESKKVSSDQRKEAAVSGQSHRDTESMFVSPISESLRDQNVPSSVKEGRKERDGESKQWLKLSIPHSKNSHLGHNKNKEVEKIFEKMTGMKTPVSAIQTPIKSEIPKFPFNETSHQHGGSGSQTIPRKKLIEAINDDGDKNGDNEPDNKESSIHYVECDPIQLSAPGCSSD